MVESAPPTSGFVCAGRVGNRGLNLVPTEPPASRMRHRYGGGPFADLVMPQLPAAPGVYLWDEDGVIVYVGQTRMPLAKRLGSNGYAHISTYNTLPPEVGRRNGGQQTNCRLNTLANSSLSSGRALRIWYHLTEPGQALAAEARWMRDFGVPAWNRRIERSRG